MTPQQKGIRGKSLLVPHVKDSLPERESFGKLYSQDSLYNREFLLPLHVEDSSPYTESLSLMSMQDSCTAVSEREASSLTCGGDSPVFRMTTGRLHQLL